MALSYERRHAGLLGLHKRPSGEFSFVGLVRSIEVNTSSVSTTGAGPDVLHTFDLPLNSLRNDEDYLTVWYAGITAANANNKAVNARFGGTSYESMGVFAIVGTVGWEIDVRIVRLSSTSVRVSHSMNFNVIAGDGAGPPNMTTFGAGGFMISRNTLIAGLPNLSANAITMDVRGSGVAAGDVTQNLSIIEIVQN